MSGVYNGRYILHAVDAMTLQERPNFPISVEGVLAGNSPPFSPSYFEGGKQLQRPALLLMDDIVYAGFGAHCDLYNFTGWVIGVHAKTGNVASAWASAVNSATPGRNGAGIWMSGAGLASDASGRLFFVTGNGDTSPTQLPTSGPNAPTILGMSVVNLRVDPVTNKTSAADFFMPYNYQALNGGDRDFGSGGITLLPDYFSSSSVARVLLAAGKVGDLYVFNANFLGGFATGPNGGDSSDVNIVMA
jgi:iron transport multicopper oxidase